MLAPMATSTGSISFGPSGGTLTTRSLLASPADLTGVGTINACGIVSDIDLRFDATHKLAQTLALQQSGQNIAVNLDLASNPASNGVWLAGRAPVR